MCGISGIVLKQQSNLNIIETVLRMSGVIQHRGPDGEGVVAFSDEKVYPLKTDYTPILNEHKVNYLPEVRYDNFNETAFAAFAHRRLAIIDLGAFAHQPMCCCNGEVWITYNGEIYNYIELREELIKEGYRFVSKTDTEVIINAYKKWGIDCVEKFNGMWAFCIYDKNKKHFFASRDRLGVKPFYYVNNSDFFAFSSEQKAFIKSGLLKADINDKALHDYIVNEELETGNANFFENIIELQPGCNMIFNYAGNSLSTWRYFSFSDIISEENNYLSDDRLIERIQQTLFEAIHLRMRSDVKIGVSLSGGIDSSAIACIMAQYSSLPVSCFTSVFKGESIGEEKYADIVVKHIKAQHFKVESRVQDFENDVKNLVYALDVPIWDTSTYAQFRVMRLIKDNAIKVVLGGQGADELFAGYHHHFMSLWDQQFKEDGTMATLNSMANSSKSIPYPLYFYAKQKLKQNLPPTVGKGFYLLNRDFVNSYEVKRKDAVVENLNNQLIADTGYRRLKSFLRCEDRCSMWHSVESRTPFSDDIHLMKLMFSFDGKRKINKGISKYFLREATKELLPPQIYSRYDKVGFETPMNEWMTEISQHMLEVITSAKFTFLNYDKLKENYKPSKNSADKLFFRLYVLAIWNMAFKE